MKKVLITLCFIAIIISNIYSQDRCVTQQYNQSELQQNGLKHFSDSMNSVIYKNAASINGIGLNSAKSTTMKVRFIPVVVHVLYSNAQENISDAQIYSQIKILNDDYSAQNGNLWSTNPLFTNLIGISGIQFYIADKDINGNDTIGIIRKTTTKTTGFNWNNDCKHNATSGDDAWNTNKYFNIWVVKLNAAGILGFSSLPCTNLSTSGNDGTVISYLAFGLSGAANAPYDLGRTATHETGHFFGLNHTFEYGCAAEGDSIKDTPPVLNANTGCVRGANSCHNDSPDMPDMIENFMDYADDGCMTMFSKGQVAVFKSVMLNCRASLGFDSTITFNTTIGIDEKTNLSNQIIVSPNPANSFINIQSKKNIVSVEVYDLVGHQIFVSNNLSSNTSYQFSIAELNNGFYFIKINQEGNNTAFTKFQKL